MCRALIVEDPRYKLDYEREIVMMQLQLGYLAAKQSAFKNAEHVFEQVLANK